MTVPTANRTGRADNRGHVFALFSEDPRRSVGGRAGERIDFPKEPAATEYLTDRDGAQVDWWPPDG